MRRGRLLAELKTAIKAINERIVTVQHRQVMVNGGL